MTTGTAVAAQGSDGVVARALTLLYTDCGTDGNCAIESQPVPNRLRNPSPECLGRSWCCRCTRLQRVDGELKLVEPKSDRSGGR